MHIPTRSASDELAFLHGGGAMGAQIRDHDWLATPLGAPVAWPAPLRTAVRIMLTTNHPVFLFWGAQSICFYNDAYSRSLGPEKHPSMLGAPGRQAWDEIWDVIGPQIDFVLTGQGATWHENHLIPITRHGRREDVYWTYSYSPVDDASAASGVGGVLVLCNETTGQVLTTERLRAAEGRWRQLFDQAPGFVCVLSGPHHVFEFANPAYQTLFGRVDFVGLSVGEALPWAIDQGFVELLDGVYRSGKAHVALTAPVDLPGDARRQATTRYVDFVYQPVHDVRGQVDGILVMGSEVTERKSAETALRRSEQRLRIACDAADLGIYDYDVAADTAVWDERTYALWGIAPGRPISYAVVDGALHPDDRALARAAVDRALDPDGERRFVVDFRVIQPGGGMLWLETSGHASFDGRRALRIVGTTADITERKLADARRYEFLATLGHELRNPLAPIANSLHLLERQPALTDSARNSHAVIGRQLKHMVRLLEDLLDVVRIANGRVELRAENVALDAVLRLALEAASAQIERGNHKIVVLTPNAPLHVHADPVRLSQVFANLIINAAKYSDAGSRIEVAIEPAGSDRVAVRVTDQGIGIAAPQIAHVFEMFSQAESSLSRSNGGLGIGLTLAKGLTELHGGSIAVRSQGLGRGSEFVVSLPLLATPEPKGPGVDPSRHFNQPLRGRRVLVVDDNHDAALTLAALLEFDGAVVTIAGDGIEALRMAEADDFESVLLDIGLPGMNGYQVCRALRARAGGAALRMVALTGWGQAEDRARTLEAGFDDHLVKPVDYQALLRAIERPAPASALKGG
jgi:PAS domain S-box-containing protein